MAPIEVSEARMSVSSGPTKLEMLNCTAAKVAPHATTAGHTSAAPAHPAIVTTKEVGIITEIMAQIRPTMALRWLTGSDVMPASVMTGMPIEPNATGAVLASRQIPAA